MPSVSKDLLNYQKGRNREWLLANGIGGYASSTIIGANTRKYHGLLIASKNPPVERRLLLSKLEETAIVDGREYALSANKYPGAVYPTGFKLQESFSLEPFPTFRYLAGGAEITKTVFMVHGRNATVVRYAVSGGEEVGLRVVPLVNDRDFHGNTLSRIGFSQLPHSKRTIVKNGDQTCIMLESDLFRYSPDERWYENMVYDFERFRGEADRDNHFSPGQFSVRFRNGGVAHMVATDGTIMDSEPSHLFRAELLRCKKVAGDGWEDARGKLLLASDSFLVRRKSTSSSTIIAGYHWFADWGRDSMISLPGLTICTGRFPFARAVLDTFAQNIAGGLVPNVFHDRGKEASYNSADASLWFIIASYKYLKASGDETFFRNRLWGRIKDIHRTYSSGTGDIRMDDDCLISCGPGLTWMDAKVDGNAVTPRNGKPVEVNALWCNCLEMIHELSNRFGERVLATESKHQAGVVRKSFRKFWNGGGRCLYDTIDPVDDSVRPNQILALGLPFRTLDRKTEEAVLRVVEEELCTPVGLRSLSPKDKKYCGSYGGDRTRRDYAYHNGTVWSWLVGPYIDAKVRLDGKKASVKLINDLKEFVAGRGMGTVPELFEADSLEPRGCFSQAWGVAEWLRVIVEYG